MKAVPISLVQARSWIDLNHRHHLSSYRDKFRIAAVVDDNIVGVVQVGRPVSRYLDDGFTLEVLRLCTDGTKNVCSFLLSRCVRIARDLGYRKIITYITEFESGSSLIASGWFLDASNVGGFNWSCSSRPRSLYSTQLSLFSSNVPKYPICKKQRWCKIL